MPLNLEDQKSRGFVTSLFHDYLLREHRSDLLRLSSSSTPVHQSVVIHFSCLCEFDGVFSELLLVRPHDTLSLLDEGLRVALNADRQINSSIKQPYGHVHVRLKALPVIPEVHRNTIPWSEDVGRFVALRATVSRVGPVQVFEECAQYVCTKCGFRFALHAKLDQNYVLRPPRFCPNRQQGCHSTSVKPISEETFQAKNYQEIRVHERFRCLSVGLMPRSIAVCLEDDLLEAVKPGDDVIVNGIVIRRWQTPRDDAPCEISLAIKANYIENLSELKTGSSSNRLSTERIVEFESFWSKHSGSWSDGLEARNQLVRGICPDVCGLYLIKLSLALILAGAPEWSAATTDKPLESTGLKSRVRGNPHILLIGDPGTAKSVLLRAATDLSSRAVLTTATGTTAAGLTATAVRDSHGWALEAGALVLADGGLCAIDEFTALHGTHRAAVHEAMEQQTISLAKAGLIARLNCRCSVLAAANPPNAFTGSGMNDQEEDFGLPTPLLSRFDLIWRLVDPINSSNWDRKTADFVLKLDKNSTTDSGFRRDNPWIVDRLREYFIWIRHEFQPQLSLQAANLLQRYYVWRRRHITPDYSSQQSTLYGRSTLRLLESLVRLTKAHARLMARRVAGVEDAIVAIALVDASLQSTTFSSTIPSVIGQDSEQMITSEAIVSRDVPANAGQEFTRWESGIHKSLAEIEPDYVKKNLDILEENEPTAESLLPPHVSENGKPLVDRSSFRLNCSLQSETVDSTPVHSTFSLPPKTTEVDFGVSLSFRPMVSSTQFSNTAEYDQENNTQDFTEWNDFPATGQPIISWPEPTSKFPFRPKKLVSNTIPSPSEQAKKENEKQKNTFSDLQVYEKGHPMQTNWKARTSSKLARFTALSPQKSPETPNFPLSSPCSSGAQTSYPALNVPHLGLKRLADIQLTNEDFEIDI
ncbi:Dna replication licensing factor mcm9 [Fasciola gigantica]|uniref:DNA helicase MCM9 n=1 Tax=Fasciola gigantica TaxID=46835 RepID=A0A504Y4H6_FASGI|nr:Dna replication licensing factor mcm9 [Fasciola gigantica]